VTLARLRRGDVVAGLAALALLFFMAMDWYSDTYGQEARRVERLAQPVGPESGQVTRRLKQDAVTTAEEREHNAYQEGGAIDGIILLLLLAAVALALTAATLRVVGRRVGGALSPSVLAAGAASIGAVLLAYRIVQQPGVDEITVVKAGAPLSLMAAVVLAGGATSAARSELVEDEAQAREDQVDRTDERAEITDEEPVEAEPAAEAERAEAEAEPGEPEPEVAEAEPEPTEPESGEAEPPPEEVKAEAEPAPEPEAEPPQRAKTRTTPKKPAGARTGSTARKSKPRAAGAKGGAARKGSSGRGSSGKGSTGGRKKS
jgi:hypothetical protein